jgi:cell division septum initiation protein DivIVA
MTELEQMRRDFAGLATENLELRAKADKLAADLAEYGGRLYDAQAKSEKLVEALRYAQEHGNTRETWQRIDEALDDAEST